MEKLLELLNESVGLDLKIKKNAKGVEAIHQTVRNDIKNDLTEALVNDFTELLGDKAEVGRTKDGVVVQVEIGGEIIVFSLDPIIKPLGYDFDFETSDYLEMLKEKEAEKIAKANKKKK